MNRRTAISLLGALSLFAAGPAVAQTPIVIKLATLAPSGSVWHNHLKGAAQKWKEVSGGRVELKIFAGGIMGNEGDMVKKLRINAIQGAALSTIGLHEITPEPQALDIPLLVETREEWAYVVSTMAPKLEACLEQNRDKCPKLPGKTDDKKDRFKVLAWSEIGFTRFFSTQARPTLDELRQGKLFSWEGDKDSTAAWKAGGFHPVVLASTDMMPSLQTGMIDTILYPPTLILALNLYSKAKFMMNLPWSTLTGATIVRMEDWEKIPADLRPQLQAAFVEASKEIVKDARSLEDKALTEMKGKGLQVVEVTDKAAWRKTLEATYGEIRGKVVPADIFDEVHRVVKDFRAGKRVTPSAPPSEVKGAGPGKDPSQNPSQSPVQAPAGNPGKGPAPKTPVGKK